MSYKRTWVSRTMGVHPSRIAETREEIKRRGLRCEINNAGFAQADTRGGRRDAHEFFNMFDRDAGYGDKADT